MRIDFTPTNETTFLSQFLRQIIYRWFTYYPLNRGRCHTQMVCSPHMPVMNGIAMGYSYQTPVESPLAMPIYGQNEESEYELLSNELYSTQTEDESNVQQTQTIETNFSYVPASTQTTKEIRDFQIPAYLAVPLYGKNDLYKETESEPGELYTGQTEYDVEQTQTIETIFPYVPATTTKEVVDLDVAYVLPIYISNTKKTFQHVTLPKQKKLNSKLKDNLSTLIKKELEDFKKPQTVVNMLYH